MYEHAIFNGFFPNIGILFAIVYSMLILQKRPLYVKGICGNMEKNNGMRLDIMNRNTIISLAMLYALWQSNRQDLLDLIRPFVLYSIGNTTKINEEINVTQVCHYMESEFGYKSIQVAVINRILAREASSKSSKSNHCIERKNKQFILIASLTHLIDEFSAKRTTCKGHSDAVTNALTKFLNDRQVYKRANYTQIESERFLLSFFERQGGSIVLSVDDLRQLKARSNEIDFFIAQFILTEYEHKSVLFDYLVELVKGYFVTTALYLQAENPNATTAAFSDVTFFLDTRLLLAYLGYKTEEENSSVQKMVKSLQKNGANLACFSYNIDEVNSILEAYKLSTISKSKRPSAFTLEYFDAHGYSYTHVDANQKKFIQRLHAAGINVISPSDVTSNSAGLLNDKRITEILLSIKSNYNQATLSDDLTAINAVSRTRKGRKYPYIEKCKAVFVTSNSILVSAVKEYIKESMDDIGFPLAITGEDLCVMAWLKDFEQSNTLPQMRLLENVLAAITPTKELMEAYFSHLDDLEHQGKIDDDEAALLRVDIFAKRELMNLTYGERNNLDKNVIDKIRHKIREESVQAGRIEARRQYEAENQSQKNKACKQAEDEVDKEFDKKERRWIRAIKFVSVVIAVAFIAGSVYVFFQQSEGSIKSVVFFLTIITTVEGALPFLSRDTYPIKWCKQYLQKKKLETLDVRKEQYLSLLEK